ncbi:MAG: DUF6446 family protein [Roseinatronobacter sp.]|nr:DUF6446 family protein [Roseinatronobacter sp.]
MDGRGYSWQQINPCCEAHFDGDPVPQGCPRKTVFCSPPWGQMHQRNLPCGIFRA